MELRNLTNTPADQELVKRPEMDGMRVHWMVSAHSTGSRRLLVNTAIFPPRVNHGLHRHPHAEEMCYLVDGDGYHLSEGKPTLQRQGDLVYIPAGEWHGFHNHTDSPVHMVSAWGGVASIEEAGYEEWSEVHPDGLDASLVTE